MKDIKNPNLVMQLPSRWVKTHTSGTLFLRDRVLAEYTFFRFDDIGEYRFSDNRGNFSGLEMVTGSYSAGSIFAPAAGQLSDMSTAMRETHGDFSSGQIISLPDGLSYQSRAALATLDFTTIGHKFLFQRDATNMLPPTTASSDAGQSRTFFIPFISKPTVSTGKTIVSFAEVNDSTSFLSIGFSAAQEIKVVFHNDDDTSCYQTFDFSSWGESIVSGDLIIECKLSDSGTVQLGRGSLSTPSSTKRIGQQVIAPETGSATGKPKYISTTVASVFLGYGNLTGGVIPQFNSDDWLNGCSVRSFTVFKGSLSTTEQEQILTVPTAGKQLWYKSGLNNEPVRRTLRKRDQRRAYPTNWQAPGQGQLDTSASPFNDMRTIDFVSQPLVMPEAIPLSMFSGSVIASSSAASYYWGTGSAPFSKRGHGWRQITGSVGDFGYAAMTQSLRGYPPVYGAQTFTTASKISPFILNSYITGSLTINPPPSISWVSAFTRPQASTGENRLETSKWVRRSNGVAYGKSVADILGVSLSDFNQTPLENRLIVDGIPKDGVFHEDTYNFGVYTTNQGSFASLGQGLKHFYNKEQNRTGTSTNHINTPRNPKYRNPAWYAKSAYNTGSIKPFDDSAVCLDQEFIDQSAVPESVWPGLNQKLGSHIAISIPLNPHRETQFGVRSGNRNKLGRQNYSMGYFNWEKDQ